MIGGDRQNATTHPLIRAERPEDHKAIARVVEAAFGRPSEARLVELVRASEHYVPELALVAEDGGAIRGHVMFSYCWLNGEGAPRRVLCMAPVSVEPPYQRNGIGGKLIEEGLHIADARGEPLVHVLGHAAYYPRFGFRSARSLGIEPPDPSIPDGVFMAKPLAGYHPAVRGRIEYPPAFQET
ncbi:MAG: N-acetyltransferase [Dehalococcoidia bacterium]